MSPPIFEPIYAPGCGRCDSMPPLSVVPDCQSARPVVAPADVAPAPPRIHPAVTDQAGVGAMRAVAMDLAALLWLPETVDPLHCISDRTQLQYCAPHPQNAATRRL
eukprot:1556928-Pyramimonas_sp.AAC.1